MSAENVGSPLTKKYSEASSKALHTLESLDDAYARMAQRVANLDKTIDPKNLDSIIHAKNDLAQIIGDLEKLQFNKVRCAPSCCMYCTKLPFSMHQFLVA